MGIKKKSKISLCLIVKGDNHEASLLGRCLSYMKDHVDAIYVTVTYVKDKKEIQPVADVCKMYGAKVSSYKWNNHFSDARNFNFSQVPKEYKWIMWLDADDVVKGAENIRSAVWETEKKNYDAIIAWYLYDFDEYKNCTVKHLKTRIVKNDNSVEWAGALHEDFKQNRDVEGLLSEVFEILHIKNDYEKEQSAQRNYEITKQYMETVKGDDSERARTCWNYGAACMGLYKWKEAIETLKEHASLTGSSEEKYMVYQRIGFCYGELGNHKKALLYGSKAMLIKPWYPDAYLLMANVYHKLEDWKRAKEFFIIALAKPKPNRSIIFFNPRDYDFNPGFKLGHTYAMLGKYKEALNLIDNVCLKMYPKHTKALEFANFLRAEVERLDKIEIRAKKLKKIKNKEVLKKALDALPIDERSHPAIVNLYNVNFINKETTGKEIAIYCGETGFIWNPDVAEEKGVGGSEEAVINLSNLLADMGWDVTVYANMGDREKKWGKVTWKPHWTFNYKDAHDIVIAWRHPILFNNKVNAKLTIVWVHDVLAKEEFTEDRLENIDKIFVLTKWHATLFPNVPKEKLFVTANGINKEDFSDITVPKIKDKFIWTSSYDRGLECLIDMWPEIKKKVPGATLDIYYGWGVFDISYIDDEPKMKWKQGLVKKINNLKKQGVTDYGRIPGKDLVRKYQEATIWAYPTEFTETYCITAIKAQIAGAIPVTTNVAGLAETAKFGEILDVKDIYTNQKAIELFVDKVAEVCWNYDNYPILEMRQWAQQFTWSKVAREWDKLFKENI